MADDWTGWVRDICFGVLYQSMPINKRFLCCYWLIIDWPIPIDTNELILLIDIDWSIVFLIINFHWLDTPGCLCPSEGHKHGVSIQSFINLGDTLLQITREGNTAETWFLARLFIYQSSIVSQILDFIHWMLTIFNFDHIAGENRDILGFKLKLVDLSSKQTV